LHSGVDVIGAAGKTVLAVCDSVTSPLACDGDCNERQITLTHPEGFQIGDGVLVGDTQWGHGFCATTATLIEKVDSNTFKISAPLYLDYQIAKEATASLVFPAVSGCGVHDVTIEGLTIDGNREKTVKTDGCRAGGIYFFEANKINIRNCTVKAYNGDGISFQVSNDVIVEDCLVDGNSGLGLHPGSGSQRPILRHNRSTHNGGDGLFVCWRVRGGLFEKNEVTGNAGAGLSIGHKDSDNLFRENIFTANAKAGILFRNELEPQGAHRNVFEKNTIVDNNKTGGPNAADIVIKGYHNNLVFRDNTIGNSSAGGPATAGIAPGKFAKDLVSENNKFTNVRSEIEKE
jgi:hypothetical protein